MRQYRTQTAGRRIRKACLIQTAAFLLGGRSLGHPDRDEKRGSRTAPPQFLSHTKRHTCSLYAIVRRTADKIISYLFLNLTTIPSVYKGPHGQRRQIKRPYCVTFHQRTARYASFKCLVRNVLSAFLTLRPHP